MKLREMGASRLQGRKNGMLGTGANTWGVKLERPTRAMMRQMCGDCLCLVGNRANGFDCEVPSCPLYGAMPWRGRPMSKALRGEEAKA